MRRRCFTKKAFSLVEVLISAGLVLLVLGLATSFLIPLLGIQADVSSDIALQQRTKLLFEQVRADIHRSSASGLSLLEESGATTFIVHRADNIAQDGTLVWDDEAVIYRWTESDHRLNRLLWNDPQRKILRASSPTKISAPQLQQILGSPSVLTRTFEGVSRFAWSHLGSASTSFTLPANLEVWFTEESGDVRQTSTTIGARLPTP